MLNFSGNTSGTFDSTFGGELPKLVNGFTLVNKTGGTIGVNVYKFQSGGAELCIMPLNLQLATGEMYEGTNQVVLLPTQNIRVQVSGSCDYDFTISNLQVDERQQQI